MTGSGPSRNSSAARRRSAAESRIPSPVVPSARIPSSPPAARKSRYGRKASSSSVAPSSRSGVTAAASAPRSIQQLYDLPYGGGTTGRAGGGHPARPDGAAGAPQRLRRRADPGAGRGLL